MWGCGLRLHPFVIASPPSTSSGQAPGRSNLLNQKISSSHWRAPRDDKLRKGSSRVVLSVHSLGQSQKLGFKTCFLLRW